MIATTSYSPGANECNFVHHVAQLFRVVLWSQTHCCVCKGKVDTVTEEKCLEIPVAGQTTLIDALKEFTKTETLDGDNEYDCSKCRNKVAATKSLKIYQAPPILVLKFNRYTSDIKRGRKLKHLIWFPETLSLNDCMLLPNVSV